MFETLIFYITRDDNGMLQMHSTFPTKENGEWKSDGDAYILNCELYKQLTPDDEPLKVILQPEQDDQTA